MTIIWYLLFFWTLQHRRDLIVDDMQHKKQQKVFVWKNKDMLQRLIIFWRCMLHSTRFIYVIIWLHSWKLMTTSALTCIFIWILHSDQKMPLPKSFYAYIIASFLSFSWNFSEKILLSELFSKVFQGQWQQCKNGNVHSYFYFTGQRGLASAANFNKVIHLRQLKRLCKVVAT